MCVCAKKKKGGGGGGGGGGVRGNGQKLSFVFLIC